MLVIRHLVDPVADALAAALGPGLRSLYIEGWLASCSITHTVGLDGVATRIEQGDDGVLLDGSTGIVLNRIAYVPTPAFHAARAVDRDYAGVEAMAVFWSCLEGLCCPVLNSAAALRMAGQAQSALGGAAQAVCAGVNTRTLRMTTRAALDDCAGFSPFGGGPSGVAVGAPGLRWLPEDGERGELWIVGDQVLGALEGVATDAVRNLAGRIGLGFGVLGFVRARPGPWLWASFDALPLDVPAAVIEALVAFVARHAPATIQGDPT